MSYEFDKDPQVKEFALRVRSSINTKVIPHESELNPDSHGINPDLRILLQSKARAENIFAPTAPKEFGGHGFNHCAQAVILRKVDAVCWDRPHLTAQRQMKATYCC